MVSLVWEDPKRDIPHIQKRVSRTDKIKGAYVREELKKALEEKRKFKVIGKYGLPFLDAYLRGIHSKDLVLIGSFTGGGKSELAYEMAFLNGRKMNVHLFALEADTMEPYWRNIYKIGTTKYYELLKQHEVSEAIPNINYRDYMLNCLPEAWNEYEEYGAEVISEEVPGLNIHYRESSFTIKTLLRKIKEIEKRIDFIDEKLAPE